MNKRSHLGSALVALAALFWATDALFRYPLSAELAPARIVFYEHSIILLVLLPVFVWMIFRGKGKSHGLKIRDLPLYLFIGAGGSAIATVLFTQSFRHTNPTVAILLQKMQPVFVVLIAHGALKERPARNFYGWAALAILAAIFLSISPFAPWPGHEDLSSQGALEALLAAVLWAIATVAGKILLKRRPTAAVVFWRFVFGWATLAIWLAISSSAETNGGLGPALFVPPPGALTMLVYTALVPGLLAMVTYYAGLTRTTASVATFIELLYPMTATFLNSWLLHAPLSLPQGVAAVVLVLSVLFIG